MASTELVIVQAPPAPGCRYHVPTSLVVLMAGMLQVLGMFGGGLAALFWRTHHPLATIAASPNPFFIGQARTQLWIVTLVIVAVLRQSLATVLHYVLGSRAVSPRPQSDPRHFRHPRLQIRLWRRSIARGWAWLLDRVSFQAWGIILVFLSPTPLTMVMAGASHTNRALTALANLSGKVVTLMVIIRLGQLAPNGFLLGYLYPIAVLLGLVTIATLVRLIRQLWRQTDIKVLVGRLAYIRP